MTLYGGLGAALVVVSVLRIVVLWKTYHRLTQAITLLALIRKDLKGKT